MRGGRVLGAAWWLDSSPHAGPRIASYLHVSPPLPTGAMRRQAPMATIIVTHQGTGQMLNFNPGLSGKTVREEVFLDWGRGHITSASNIRITAEDVDLPAGDYSFCPGMYLICP